MKKIKSFHCTEDTYYLDLEDAKASIVVNPSNGQILLDEGLGDKRFNGAFLRPESINHLFLSKDESIDNGFNLVLNFGNNKFHFLGMTNEPEKAEEWIQKVTDIISKHKKLRAEEELFLFQKEFKNLLIRMEAFKPFTNGNSLYLSETRMENIAPFMEEKHSDSLNLNYDDAGIEACWR